MNRPTRKRTRSLRIETLESRAVCAADGIGFYQPGSSMFHLKESFTPGNSDLYFNFGPSDNDSWQPLTGDWNGDGADSVGFYDPWQSLFHLKNQFTPGASDYYFQFGPAGNAGWEPLVGDWDGDGFDSIGFYQPDLSLFHLKNSFQPGNSDIYFQFGPTGNSGWQPLVGDWNGDGVDTIGFYQPDQSLFHLKNSFSPGASDQYFQFGPGGNAGWQALIGDWNGDSLDTIGLYQPDNSLFHLKNSFSPGASDVYFQFGPVGYAGWKPLTGDWESAAPPVDTTPPEVSITSSATRLGRGETTQIRFSFNEPVPGFSLAVVQVTGGELVQFSGSGTSFTATLVPWSSSTAPAIVSLPSGAFADAAGNYNTVPASISLEVNTLPPDQGGIDQVDIPAFSSNPGARHTMYLDFNGYRGQFRYQYLVKETVYELEEWEGLASSYAFDMDGNFGSLSAEERTAIERIWAIVAEDYSPFDINVTTVVPTGVSSDKLLTVVIGSQRRLDNPWSNEFGLAHIGCYSDNYPNMVFVVSDMLLESGESIDYVGSTTSHEAGHAYGLRHSSIVIKNSDGTCFVDRDRYPETREYNPGDSEISPIMGNGSGRRTLWANDDSWRPQLGGTKQYYERKDDIYKLRYVLGERQTEPENLTQQGNSVTGSGVISYPEQRDYWWFETCAGDVSFDVTVPEGINNLDVKVQITDQWGNVKIDWVAPSDSFGATIRGRLNAGFFRLVIKGNGLYGDVGQYKIQGTVQTDAYIGLRLTNANLKDASGAVDRSTQVSYIVYGSDRSTVLGSTQLKGQWAFTNATPDGSSGSTFVRLKVNLNQTNIFYVAAFHNGVACTDYDGNSLQEVRIFVDRLGKFVWQQPGVRTAIYPSRSSPNGWYRVMSTSIYDDYRSRDQF